MLRVVTALLAKLRTCTAAHARRTFARQDDEPSSARRKRGSTDHSKTNRHWVKRLPASARSSFQPAYIHVHGRPWIGPRSSVRMIGTSVPQVSIFANEGANYFELSELHAIATMSAPGSSGRAVVFWVRRSFSTSSEGVAGVGCGVRFRRGLHTTPRQTRELGHGRCRLQAATIVVASSARSSSRPPGTPRLYLKR
jgi:hypothetical protein